MERNPETNRKQKIFTTRNLTLMAALIAIQIILARFFSIQTDTLRLSFEIIPGIQNPSDHQRRRSRKRD